MTNIVYSGEKSKKASGHLNGSLLDAKKNESIDPDCDILSFVIDNKGSSLPLSIENYINTVVKERDNKGLGYIYAIFLDGKGMRGAANRLNTVLEHAGCILSYYNSIDNIQSALKDIDKEEFNLSSNGLIYRLIKRRVKAYDDTEEA